MHDASGLDALTAPRREELALPPGPALADVDLDAVAANVRVLRSALRPGTLLAAVVKASAYGLGAVPVARAALAAGADWLCVARVREGVELRRAGLAAPILITASFTPEEAETIARHRLTPTVSSVAQVAALARAADRVGQRLAVHVKVETGLHRYGAPLEEALACAAAIAAAPALALAGLSSHLAIAEEPADPFNQEQIAAFRSARAAFDAAGYRGLLCHLGNSAAALALPAAQFDMVRCGIALHGGLVVAGTLPTPTLREPLTLRTRVARCFTVPAGASVGYGRAYVAPGPRRAALVPLGYADGLPRALGGRGAMLVRGRRAPIIGRVSMDQCVVDISEIPAVQTGDEVVVIGAQREERISLAEVAEWAETIPHEVLCRLGPRVPRRYLRAGEVLEVALLGPVPWE